MALQKLLVITGQTATGKTALAGALAKLYTGEIISADSRQIYKHMTILTGEDLGQAVVDHTRRVEVVIDGKSFTLSPKVQDGISYWLTDFVSPDIPFTVASYCICARAVVSYIASHNHLPILVGGTGLYIRALIDPSYAFTAPPDAAFRVEAAGWSRETLQQKVREMTPSIWETLNESDRNNPRRLVRCIERSMTKDAAQPVSDEIPLYDAYTIFLTRKDGLYDAIDARVDDRIRVGALKEIAYLYSRWKDAKLPSLSTTGYKRFLDPSAQIPGTPEYDRAIKQWKFDEHGYARRQKTWLKKYTDGMVFDVGDADVTEKIAQHVARWYTGKNV